MSEQFALPGDISVTQNVLDVVRDGLRFASVDVQDTVGSITFMIPSDTMGKGRWGISWLSRKFTPDRTLFRIGDIELALSLDAQNKLRGKVVDIVNGTVDVRDRASGEVS